MRASDTSIDLLTLAETAELLRISKPTIYRLIRTDGLATVKLGRRTLVERAEIRRFVDARRKRRAP